ncbi:MAG: hypothetical protein AB7O55_18340 [Lautropia sp.]
MNTRILAVAALTLTGALSAGTANAYMGDGCGRDAQLRYSHHAGRLVCRPIVRGPAPVFIPAPVAVMPAPRVLMRPPVVVMRAPVISVPAYPRFVPVAPRIVPVAPGFGGYGGSFVNRQAPGGYARGVIPAGRGGMIAPAARAGHAGHTMRGR